MKRKLKKVIIYMLPALIVLVIMLTVFLIKGMYPFKNLASLQIDADYNYVPTLFKIHDIFHYKDSILWDFKIGSGANIYGSLVMNSIYSPINWLVILVKRDNIINFYNILLIIKFMLMATTMFIFIRKNFKKTELFWQVLLSVLYVFSGWGFLMYSNIFYIDTVILFPIIMHYYIKMFKEKNNLGLIITLSYSLIINFYLTYMIYLFIIFSGLLIIMTIVKKENRKEIIVKLSLSLVIPLIIAAFSYLPALAQIQSSIRISNTEKSEYFYYIFLKIINLTMSALLIIMPIKYIKNKSVDKKEKNFYIALLALTTIGVVIEPINEIWHTGNYNSFPYRYSFITIFTLICGCLRYTEIRNLNKEKNTYKSIFPIILFCEIIIIFFYSKYNKIIIDEMISFDIAKPGIFITLIIIFILLYIIYQNILKLENKKVQKILLSIFVLLEILINCNWCFNDYGYDQSTIGMIYKKQTSIPEDNLYKYCDYQALAGVNSSYITRGATLSNWLHIIPKKQMEYSINFGYTKTSTILYGYGGTILTDSIIGIKKIYSEKELSNEAYNLNKTFEINDNKMYEYDMKYDMSFGFKYNKLIAPGNFDSSFETHNYYYKELFGINKEIINIENIKVESENTNYVLNIKEPVILYIEINEELQKSKIAKAIINDEEINLKGYKKIAYIGNYSKPINIIIKNDGEQKEPVTLKFGYIKISDYKEMTKYIKNKYNKFEYKKNKLHINIDSEEEQYLFLPINNIDGWIAKNNGKKIKIEDELYTFMSIKLEKGNNDIELEFQPPLLEKGIIISIVGALLLIIYKIFENKITKNGLVQKIIIPIYYIVSLSLLIYVYIISNFIYK